MNPDPAGPRLVFLCSSTSWGGLEQGVARLARWMRERGHTVTLYAVKDSPLALGARDLDVRLIRRHRRHGDPVNALRLARMLRRDGAAVLMTFDARDIGIASMVKAMLRGGVRIVHYQNMQIGVDKRDLLHRRQHARIDAWIAPLEHLAREALEKTHLRPDQVTVIPHGIEVDRFLDTRMSREEARVRLALPADAFIAGLTGRVDPGKGHHVLLEALRRLDAGGIAMHALFVGDPTIGEGEPYLARLLAMTGDHGLAGRVNFRPFMADIEVAYRAMDVFVLGTYSETFGMVTVEAMLSGVPVVATASGGTPEVLGGGAYGLLYPPGDAAALADRLAALKLDPNMSAGLAARAREYAARTFSHLTECARLEALLHDLLHTLPGR